MRTPGAAAVEAEMKGFKVADVASSGNDEFYTPAYAITPLLRHLPPPSSKRPITVWCPFDTEQSLFVKTFRLFGYQVIATHISAGYDFFKTEPPECDYIISNPPYSLKGEVLERLFSLGTPFAMLVGNAIKKVSAEEHEALDAKVNTLIKVLKFIIAESGFELAARIELRDRKTGRFFR